MLWMIGWFSRSRTCGQWVFDRLLPSLDLVRQNSLRPQIATLNTIYTGVETDDHFRIDKRNWGMHSPCQGK